MSSGQCAGAPKVFIFLPADFTAAWLSQRQERFECGGSMLRCVSPLAGLPQRSYQQVTVRRGVWFSLGTRIGLATAFNDRRVQRLTGSLPLLQPSCAGAVIDLFSKSRFGFSELPPLGGKSNQGLGARGGTRRPMAQTKPANSRATAAAATWGFLRPRQMRWR